MEGVNSRDYKTSGTQADNSIQASVTLRSINNIRDVDTKTWNRLNELAKGSVLTSHQMLDAFERSGSICPSTGWQPHHLLIERDGLAIAAVPLYAKSHSYGEFVFDFTWAEAHERHGLPYYPKWLCGIPLTPVTSPRLLCADQDKGLAAHALMKWAQSAPLFSMHTLFTDATDQAALTAAGFLERTHVQFHWINQGWGSFDDFLTDMSQGKRKKIRAERRKVARAGIYTQVLTGHEISASDWDFFYQCYVNTYALRGRAPYLTRAFFEQASHDLADNCMMVIAYREQLPIASALSWLDTCQGAKKLYGRYWGSTEYADSLHFEVAYYSALDWAIANQIDVFEGGAQGQHKMARGFVPVLTHSAHWLKEPQFHDAIRQAMEIEKRDIMAYTQSLSSPFKAG